jgi:hypothetical protein
MEPVQFSIDVIASQDRSIANFVVLSGDYRCDMPFSSAIIEKKNLSYKVFYSLWAIYKTVSISSHFSELGNENRRKFV